MRLYRTANGGWVGTQAEAKSGGRGWEMVEVPTTPKEDFIVWLNINARPPVSAAERDEDADPTGTLEAFAHGQQGPVTVEGPPPPPPPTRAGPLGLIAVEEFIQNAEGGDLASCASNVAWRFKELAKHIDLLS